MKNLNHGKIYFIGLVIFCLGLVFSLLTMAFNKSQRDYSFSLNNISADNSQIESQLITDYQAQINQLLPSCNYKDRDSREQTRQKLLSLRVPKIYKDYHFKLISTLDQLDQDVPFKPEQKSSLQDFFSKYSELGRITQNYILNNL